MDPGRAATFRPETLKAIDVVGQALRLAGQGVVPAETAPKGERDLVTTTDFAVEDAIRAPLEDAFGLPVVGEERGGEAPADGSAYWLVDPICGTRNLASRMPLYCVNLALVEAGHVTISVVADPSLVEIAAAERAQGAWVLKDGARRRLTTSDQSSTVVIEEVKALDARREHTAEFIAATIRANRWDFRSLGTTLGLLYLADGRVSAYAAPWCTAVHAAAGALLVTEAGATLTDIEGRAWTVDSDSVLAAANDELHAQLLHLARATASASVQEKAARRVRDCLN